QPQRIMMTLVKENHRKGSSHPAEERSNGSTLDSHAKAVNKDGISSDIGDIHDQTDDHAHLAVALAAEKSSAAVKQGNKRIAESTEEKVGVGSSHYIRFDAAINSRKDLSF